MKKVAILQSNYIPWKGYFDIINSVDEFVIYDEVQYTKNDWRNRNILKGKGGLHWITIPCRRERHDQKISETRTSGNNWSRKHLNSIKVDYSRAASFRESIDKVTGWYENVATMEYLSDINIYLLRSVCEFLNISTKISSSVIYKSESGINKRLVGICKEAQADIYLTGSSAKNYLDEKLFLSQGISVEYIEYGNYSQYPQVWPPFEHKVSIIDMILNIGQKSGNYLKSGIIEGFDSCTSL